MKLKEWRISKGLSVRKMGEALGWPGIHPGSSIHHYETGYCRPRFARAAQISRFTSGEVTLDDLFSVPLRNESEKGKKEKKEKEEQGG